MKPRYFIAAVVLTCLAFSLFPNVAFAEPAVGDRAKNFKGFDIVNREVVELEDYLGQWVFVDFWASWCGPCMAFAPVFEKLQQEYQGEFIFTKVNVDAHQPIANRYRITAIPTTIFVKNGELVNKVVGAISEKAMKGFLEKLKNS